MQSPFTRFKTRNILFDFVLISFGLVIIVSLASLSVGINFEIKNEFVNYILNCLIMILVCVTTYFRLKKYQFNFKQLIGKTSFNDVPWLLLFIVFYAQENIVSAFSYLTLFITNIFSPDLVKSAVEELEIQYVYNTHLLLLKVLYFVLVTFSLVIIAPITEEFIFRGVLLHRLNAKWGITSALLVTSILFGLAHLDIFFLERTISGVIQALLYIKTRMLLVPVLLHAMHNALVLINTIIRDFSSSNNKDPITVAYLWYVDKHYTFFFSTVLFP